MQIEYGTFERPRRLRLRSCRLYGHFEAKLMALSAAQRLFSLRHEASTPHTPAKRTNKRAGAFTTLRLESLIPLFID